MEEAETKTMIASKEKGFFPESQVLETMSQIAKGDIYLANHDFRSPLIQRKVARLSVFRALCAYLDQGTSNGIVFERLIPDKSGCRVELFKYAPDLSDPVSFEKARKLYSDMCDREKQADSEDLIYQIDDFCKNV